MFSAKLIVLVLLGQTPDPKPDAAALVEKLGSASYAEREATKSLESLGSKALPALRSALKTKDLEVRARARAMINKIESTLLIQESLVRLDFTDASLDEIVQSIKKQTGIEVGLGRAGPDTARVRITLRETQPIAFWKAIDRLCEDAKLTCHYQYLGARGSAVVLSSQPNLLNQPSYNHGPFHVSVVSLSYQSDVLFQQNGPILAQMRPGAPRIAGVVKKKGVRPPAEPPRTGAARPVEAENARTAPARNVQFRFQLQIAPEPRMAFSQAGNVKLLEAVDELGQSLLPFAPDVEQPFGPAGMMGAGMMAGSMAQLVAPLRRPEMPGKQIKTLRGTVDVKVSAPRPNPLKIPLENAAGKTFQNEDRHVVVNSIDADPMTRRIVIELTIEDIEDLFPADGAGGVGPGAGRGMMRGRVGPSVESDMSHGPIQIFTSTGQYAFYLASIDRDSGRVTLTLPHVTQMVDLKEIGISSIVRATAKIPFEFHDLLMP